MTNLRPGKMNFPEGSRLLILDFYDGMSEGILQLGPNGPVLYLKMTGNEFCGDVVRTFYVDELPETAFEECAKLLMESQTPKWPTWYPIWEFNDEKTQRAVEAVLDKVVAQGIRTDWELTSPDIISLETFSLSKVNSIPSFARTA